MTNECNSLSHTQKSHTHARYRYLADLFGSKHVGAIHGRTLTAWSAAALVGPGILANLRGMSHTQVCGERKRGKRGQGETGRERERERGKKRDSIMGCVVSLVDSSYSSY